MIGLGQAEAADQLALGEAGQEALALLFGAVGMDRVHDQARLHAHGRAVAAVHPLDLARDQPVGDVVDPGAAIALDGRAEQPQLPHLGHDLAVETLVPVSLQDARHQPILAVGPRGVAQHALFLAELVLEQ